MWPRRYFSGHYWPKSYFPQSAGKPPGGIYFAQRYFAPRYFQNGYFARPTGALGAVSPEVPTGGHYGTARERRIPVHWAASIWPEPRPAAPKPAGVPVPVGVGTERGAMEPGKPSVGMPATRTAYQSVGRTIRKKELAAALQGRFVQWSDEEELLLLLGAFD